MKPPHLLDRLFVLEDGTKVMEVYRNRRSDRKAEPMRIIFFFVSIVVLMAPHGAMAESEVNSFLIAAAQEPGSSPNSGDDGCQQQALDVFAAAGVDLNLLGGRQDLGAIRWTSFGYSADGDSSRSLDHHPTSASECRYRQQSKAPNPWFFAERSYPLGFIPRQAWRNAQAQAAAAGQLARESQGEDVWMPRGPVNIGGRITDMVVDPSDGDTVYAGAAEGGVFRSYDGGQSWTAIFDQMPTLAIGALAIDPNNSNVIYAGTGEVNPGGGGMAYGGSGLYRSENQGDTWELIGLENSGSIGRIRIDPGNSQRIFVAAMGMLWENNAERGVYRTIDGGDSWEQVLFVDNQTGCVDLIQRPDTPNIIFAAMWQRIRQPEYYDYGGLGCSIQVSTDGGDTWNLVGGGLPTPSADGGRIGLSLCDSQPNVMHAIYADKVGYFDGLYRSIDGGTTWAQTTDGALTNVFSSYGWWFGNVRTHPLDPDTIYVLGLDFWKSIDGGASYFNASDGMHVDHHGLDFGPGVTPVAFCGNDGGVYRSIDNGENWTKLPDLPITQIYRLALDASNPAALYLGAQDNSTCRTLTGADDDWEMLFGGDGMQPLVHPQNSDVIWAQSQYGNIGYSSNAGLSWISGGLGILSTDRRTWNAPLIQDPENPDLRYFGTHRVYHNTTDRNWEAISPDLTGGPHQDNWGQVAGTLTSLSVSPLDTNVLWAGSDDGFVHFSANGGVNWTDVKAGLPDRWITSVRTDPFDRETAYVTISGFRWTEPLPHVFRTTNLGTTWRPIAGNLPEVPVNDLLADPYTSGRYFIATDVGVFETRDRGTVWTMLGPDLPNVVVTSLILDRQSRTLIAGTYGRSVYSTSVDLDLMFYDSFEAGDLSGWSATSP